VLPSTVNASACVVVKAWTWVELSAPIWACQARRTLGRGQRGNLMSPLTDAVVERPTLCVVVVLVRSMASEQSAGDRVQLGRGQALQLGVLSAPISELENRRQAVVVRP